MNFLKQKFINKTEKEQSRITGQIPNSLGKTVLK